MLWVLAHMISACRAGFWVLLSYPQLLRIQHWKIYENRAFTRFRWLSVEIIEENFSEKVIHNMFNHASFAH
jgi:hypothetical protein